MLNQGTVFLAVLQFLRPGILLPAITTQSTRPVGSNASIVVYIEDFRQAQSGSSTDELLSLLTTAPALFQLRLLEIPSLNVRRVHQAPACGRPAPSPQSEPLPLLPHQPEATPSGHFLVVRGSVEFRPPDVALEYAAQECDGENLKAIFQDTLPFTIDQALEGVTIAAHAVASALVKAAPRTQVALEITTDGDSPEQKELQTNVQDRVAAGIAESADLEVATIGDYKVVARITYKKVSVFRKLVQPKGWNEVETEELYIQVRDKKYPLPPVVAKSKDEQDQFPAEVALVVQRNLNIVVLAEERGWPELSGTMEIEALRDRGKQLLGNCTNPLARTCPDAQDAIPLLTEAVSKAKGLEREQEVRECLLLLSQAQTLVGNYPRALASLDEAFDLVKHDRETGKSVPSAEETALLNMRGDVCIRLKDYKTAVQAYDASLQILPLQPEVYASKAVALRFDGRRQQALESVLVGFETPGTSPASPALHTAALDVIRDLHADELTQAEDAIKRAEGGGVHLADEHALLISRREEQILDADWTALTATQAQAPLKEALDRHPANADVRAELYINLARAYLFDSDPQKADDYLTQAEKMPPDQVSLFNRAWIHRIRSLYWIKKNDYAKAYASAVASRQIEPSDDADYLAARADLLWAEDKDRALGSAKTPEQRNEITKLYQQSADLAGSLVAKRYVDGDILLVDANHALGLDADSRARFEGIVNQDPKDDSALNALMFVCSQYLFDFDCAFSAAKRDAPLHEPNTPGAAEAYVNLAETAILTGNDKQTRDWLDIALKQTNATPREKSLTYLYDAWYAIRQDQGDQLSTDFQAWRTATEQFRQTHEDLNWAFLGARKVLQVSALGAKRKGLLTSMMTALEDNSQPLPRSPGTP